MDVLGAIRESIRRHHLLPRGETIIVGVSGGPDSVCLLHALTTLRAESGCSIHVAHLNHQLRGVEAEADADYVRDLARHWGLPSTVESRNVAALARDWKMSIEEAARRARYTFLAETAVAHNSRTVAVAHNADDQTESVLMHFLRGSGASGLRGMLPISDLGFWISDFQFRHPHSAFSAPQLIRPLLSVPRSEIEGYCREHDLHPRLDASNLDTTFFRNRLRHELLPALEAYNPNIREVLRRTADVIAAEVDVLRAASESAWRACVTDESDGVITFDLSPWRRLPLALRRSTLREAVRRLRPSMRNVNFVHIDDAATRLQDAPTGTRLTLPQKLMLRVDYQTFRVTDAGDEPDRPGWPLIQPGTSATVGVPGSTPLPDSDWRLEATLLDAWGDDIRAGADAWTAYLDAVAGGASLLMRARAAGDVFHPQGMPSSVRLTDWMTNAKIPRAARDRLPLVLAGDRIAWVAGFRVGHPFIVTPTTRRVLRLSFRR